MCSAATHSLNCRNDEQASSSFVFAGKIACSSEASFLLCSLLAASCSLAVGPFFSQRIGLYDCAAARAAPRNTSTAIRPATTHLIFIFTPSLHDPGNGCVAGTSERAGPRLGMSCGKLQLEAAFSRPLPQTFFRELGGPVLPQCVTPVHAFSFADLRPCTFSRLRRCALRLYSCFGS